MRPRRCAISKTLSTSKGHNAGATLARPAMSEFTADIKAGTIGAVITQDAARVARNFALVNEWRELLRAHGVKLITLADGEIDERGDGLTYSQVG
jgi:DNA invertase Pin-like site-specific DNA recombinase